MLLQKKPKSVTFNQINEVIWFQAKYNLFFGHAVHEDLKSTPPLAKSNPTAVAVAGEGGSAQSAPKGSAIAGPSGLAVSNPIATALAGDYDKKPTNKP